jgi:hypothetical protein
VKGLEERNEILTSQLLEATATSRDLDTLRITLQIEVDRLHAINCDRLTSQQLVSLRNELHLASTAVRGELHNRSQCVICVERGRSMVFMPCLHRVCCESCTTKVDRCPLCKSHIQQKLLPFDT